jgi:hypothetical protein
MRALLLLALGAASQAGCGTVVWINDVTASPDGKSVIVVGAQYRKHAFSPPTAEKGIRWICRRGGSEVLICHRDDSEHPRPKS